MIFGALSASNGPLLCVALESREKSEAFLNKLKTFKCSSTLR